MKSLRQKFKFHIDRAKNGNFDKSLKIEKFLGNKPGALSFQSTSKWFEPK